MGFSHEVIHQLWDDKHGDRLEIGPDRDGLGLIELRYFDPANECTDSLTIVPDQIGKIVEILETIKRAQPPKAPSGPTPR